MDYAYGIGLVIILQLITLVRVWRRPSMPQDMLDQLHALSLQITQRKATLRAAEDAAGGPPGGPRPPTP